MGQFHIDGTTQLNIYEAKTRTYQTAQRIRSDFDFVRQILNFVIYFFLLKGNAVFAITLNILIKKFSFLDIFLRYAHFLILSTDKRVREPNRKSKNLNEFFMLLHK